MENDMFRCPTCEKSFTTRDGLELHEKSHEPEKPQDQRAPENAGSGGFGRDINAPPTIKN